MPYFSADISTRFTPNLHTNCPSEYATDAELSCHLLCQTTRAFVEA